MRQLEKTIEEKALLADTIINIFIDEFNNAPPVEKKYHSRGEKIYHRVHALLYRDGFVTNQGIQGEEKSR